MLKISIKDSHTRRLLVLEGKIIAPWTDELSKAACQNLVSHLAGRELVIDLQGVTDISADGEEALYCLMVQGAKFRGGGVFIKQVLKQLAQRVRRNRQLHWQKGE
jgi:anti-anti-sigma regulatory factor